MLYFFVKITVLAYNSNPESEFIYMGFIIESGFAVPCYLAMRFGCSMQLDKPEGRDIVHTGRIGGHIARLSDSRNPDELTQFASALQGSDLPILMDRRIYQIAGSSVPDTTMFWTVGPFVWSMSHDAEKTKIWAQSGDYLEERFSALVGELPADVCFRLPCPDSITDNHRNVLLARKLA